MSKTNLEFRKLKSLKYLYEITLDGRHMRNVKSKKEVEIVPRVVGTEKVYFAKIPTGKKQEYHMVDIADLLTEVREYKPTAYKLTIDGDEEIKISNSDVIDTLVNITGIPRKRIKDRLKERRSHIGNVDIEYIF